MKRIKLIVLALIAASALSGAMAASSQAVTQCMRVAEQGTGNWSNATCTEKAGTQPKEYVLVNEPGLSLGAGIMCAEVIEANTGNYSNSQCTNKVTGNFIKVYERPHWWIQGKQLKQGSKQIKLQLKGIAVLKSEISGIGPVTIECNTGISEGATIDGYGINQGQGKGRISFTSCRSNVCTPAEPIVTKQTKAHLATISGHQSKYVELFEPTEGEVFTTLKLGVLCGTLNVTGSVAAEILPGGENELQEGELVFPEAPIKSILHEGREVTPGLFLGLVEAKFAAAFGARLDEGGKFGVFGGN